MNERQRKRLELVEKSLKDMVECFDLSDNPDHPDHATWCEAAWIVGRDGTYETTVDGVDYKVEISDRGATIRVLCAGEWVAMGARNSVHETLSFTHYGDEDAIAGGDQRDLYEAHWEEIARWLVSTHPESA